MGDFGRVGLGALSARAFFLEKRAQSLLSPALLAIPSNETRPLGLLLGGLAHSILAVKEGLSFWSPMERVKALGANCRQLDKRHAEWP